MRAMRGLRPFVLCSLLTLPALSGCAGRMPYATVSDSGLELDTVVLYRNGVGYFERRGRVDGDVLRLRVRKDQVNDLLKSLTIVDEDGKAVSVSMPLDPQTWASAAMATLAPGSGSLPRVLDSLRGTDVTVRANNRYVRGRIVMVERIINEPNPNAESRGIVPTQIPESRDWKLTLLSRGQLEVVRLSAVKSINLHDGDLAMQLHRSLDASAGEGMFEQVDIELRLVGARSHRLIVSYVVGAPMWKPTYRVVLPEAGKGEALLQGWAVVDNISGEDWGAVNLSLTSGAPISFRYDLHTPREVYRADMSQSGVDKRAAVALGETSWGETEAAPMPEPEPQAAPGGGYGRGDASGFAGNYDGAEEEDSYDYDESEVNVPTSKSAPAKKAEERWKNDKDYRGSLADTTTATVIDTDTLRRSTLAAARSQRIAGLTRIDLQDPVTVPDGTSTMVALINESVAAEQTFLFKPGGAGYGYEQNPYRVLRFTNSTQYVLEPGPISIYSGGSFVGEGLSEAVGAGTSVTIPFAVEAGIMVSSSQSYGQEMTLTRIVRGVLEVETYYQTTTTWTVRGAAQPEGFTVLIRQPQSGSNYSLATRPEGTEDLENAWLVPIEVGANKREAELEVVEQTPSRTTLEIWDPQAPALLEKLLSAGNLDASARAKLQPVLERRRAIGKIDTQINGLHRQVDKLEDRAEETRKDLESLQKNKSAKAKQLRAKLVKRLDEFSSEAASVGREILELENQRLEQVIELEDLLENLDLRAAATPE